MSTAQSFKTGMFLPGIGALSPKKTQNIPKPKLWAPAKIPSNLLVPGPTHKKMCDFVLSLGKIHSVQVDRIPVKLIGDGASYLKQKTSISIVINVF